MIEESDVQDLLHQEVHFPNSSQRSGRLEWRALTFNTASWGIDCHGECTIVLPS